MIENINTNDYMFYSCIIFGLCIIVYYIYKLAFKKLNLFDTYMSILGIIVAPFLGGIIGLLLPIALPFVGIYYLSLLIVKIKIKKKIQN